MSGRWRGRMEEWLFAPVSPWVGTGLRMGLGALLAYAYWPSGRVRYAGALGDWAGWSLIYREVFLSVPYQVAMLAGVAVFFAGWRVRLTGLVLAALLLPHGFLLSGQQSRQILVFALAGVSLLPSLPLWRVRKAWRTGVVAVAAGPVWPLRLVQLQLTVVYGVNAVCKSTPEFWSGEVLTGLSRKPNFLVDLTEGFWRVGGLAVPVAALAVATVVVEYGLALGFWWRRTWLPAVLAGVGFHLTLKFVMKIFMLDLATMFLYLAFLLPAAAEARERSVLVGRNRS